MRPFSARPLFFTSAFHAFIAVVVNLCISPFSLSQKMALLRENIVREVLTIGK
jgi:hypothetical protein